MNKPYCCGSCSYSERVNPEERRCKKDGHIFDDTLAVLIERRDRNCPLDSEEGCTNDKRTAQTAD